MSLMISVSGVRGVVGTDFNPQNMVPLLRAFVGMLEQSAAPGGDQDASPAGSGRTVLVGRDTRKSGPFIEKVVHGVINGLGWDTVSIGIAPTPAVLLATRELGCAGGIAITASHNPPEWNAFKFCTSEGLFLPPEDMQRMKDGSAPLAPWRPGLPGSSSERDGARVHVHKVLEGLDVQEIRKRRFSVAIDPGGGAGSAVDRAFLETLGCDVSAVNEHAAGEFPRSPEPLPEHLKGLCGLIRSSGAHVGFAQDPDADRLAVVDEQGRPLGEEYTLVLAGEAFLARKKTSIACNLSTSLMVDRLAERHRVEIVRTKIGEANVTKALLENGFQFGGEGNGGVIVPSINPCRDSLVGMGLVLELLVSDPRPLSQIVQSLPSYVMLKTKTPLAGPADNALYQALLEHGRTQFEQHLCDTSDGIKFHTRDEFLHIRGSNTEPVARIIAESPTMLRSEQLVQEGLRLLKMHALK